MPPLEWNRLRPWNGSQPLAFEELCCQLAGAEEKPEGSQFVRKASPDAGVECYWKLPNGEEHGWQAKFFTSTPDDSQWQQIDGSVQKALEKHPKLSVYVICLPIDRQDPRIDKQKWFMDKWCEHEGKWKQWAAQKGMSVEFPYWGQHEIWGRLSLDKHAGRMFFWFNEEYLCPAWFKKNLDIAIEDAGPRYTPDLNVELPISKVFDAIGRTDNYRLRLKKLIRRIRKGYTNISSRIEIQEAKKAVDDLDKNLQQCTSMLNMLCESSVTTWEIDDAETVYKKSLRSIDDLRQKYFEKENELKSKQQIKTAVQMSEFDYELYNLRELENVFYDLMSLIRDPSFQVANKPALLVLGDPGTGKTHLFCDIAKERLFQNIPTLLFLGQHFANGDPWVQMISRLGLPATTTREVLLGSLEASAQASGYKVLIMIDALNESRPPLLWHDNLAGVLELLKRFPSVGIAVSVRTSYQDVTLPENLIGNKITAIEHTGFADCGYEAVKKFFQHYHIQLPSVPFLDPEFHNPLFLKIFCEGLHKNGEYKIPEGLKGITGIFDFYLDSINSKLAKDYPCYDIKKNLVQKSAYKFAAEIADGSIGWLDYEKADELIKTIWPIETYSILPLKVLISEGLFSVDRFTTESGSRFEGVKFCYQRFSDHIISEYLLRKYGFEIRSGLKAKFNVKRNRFLNLQRSFILKYKKLKLKKAFKKPTGPLGRLVKDEYSCWANGGLIEALSVQIPEFVGCELVDLAPGISDYEHVQTSFVSSLTWRDPKCINENTLKYINNRIIHSESFTKLLEAFLSVAPLPYHPYNADFLHSLLLKHELSVRDSWWSTYLHIQYGEKGSVDRLIDWAWSNEDKSHISDDSVRLCAKTICWFFTSSNRYLRDRATKALVSLLTGRIHIVRELLYEFQGVNDPYVSERLYASAYGCAMRSTNKVHVIGLAKDVYKIIFKEGVPPPNISLREYARCLIELALHYDPNLEIDPDKVRPPYHSVWPENIPTVEEVKSKYQIHYHDKISKEDRAQGRIVFSVLDWDFARYVIGTNSGNFNWSSHRLGTPRQPSNREIYNKFFASFNTQQKDAWDKLQRIKNRVEQLSSLINNNDMTVSFGANLSKSSVFQNALVLAEGRFLYIE
jgi:hypothetical protein